MSGPNENAQNEAGEPTAGGKLSQAIKRMEADRQAGVAYVFAKANWMDEAGDKWTTTWAKACRLAEFESGVGAARFVRARRASDHDGELDDKWIMVPHEMGALADRMREAVGGEALRCEVWHGMAGELSAETPIVALCLENRGVTRSKAEVELWGSALRSLIGGWLGRLGVPCADFEFTQSMSDWRGEAAKVHLEDVRGWGKSQASRVAIESGLPSEPSETSQGVHQRARI